MCHLSFLLYQGRIILKIAFKVFFSVVYNVKICIKHKQAPSIKTIFQKNQFSFLIELLMLNLFLSSWCCHAKILFFLSYIKIEDGFCLKPTRSITLEFYVATSYPALICSYGLAEKNFFFQKDYYHHIRLRYLCHVCALTGRINWKMSTVHYEIFFRPRSICERKYTCESGVPIRIYIKHDGKKVTLYKLCCGCPYSICRYGKWWHNCKITLP